MPRNTGYIEWESDRLSNLLISRTEINRINREISDEVNEFDQDIETQAGGDPIARFAIELNSDTIGRANRIRRQQALVQRLLSANTVYRMFLPLVERETHPTQVPTPTSAIDSPSFRAFPRVDVESGDPNRDRTLLRGVATRNQTFIELTAVLNPSQFRENIYLTSVDSGEEGESSIIVEIGNTEGVLDTRNRGGIPGGISDSGVVSASNLIESFNQVSTNNPQEILTTFDELIKALIPTAPGVQGVVKIINLLRELVISGPIFREIRTNVRTYTGNIGISGFEFNQIPASPGSYNITLRFELLNIVEPSILPDEELTVLSAQLLRERGVDPRDIANILGDPSLGDPRVARPFDPGDTPEEIVSDPPVEQQIVDTTPEPQEAEEDLEPTFPTPALVDPAPPLTRGIARLTLPELSVFLMFSTIRYVDSYDKFRDDDSITARARIPTLPPGFINYRQPNRSCLQWWDDYLKRAHKLDFPAIGLAYTPVQYDGNPTNSGRFLSIRFPDLIFRGNAEGDGCPQGIFTRQRIHQDYF